MRTLPAGLVRASHPEPTVAVTVLATVLFVSAGNTVTTCVLGALALLTGQLSIGWSNDLVDAGRDAAAGRSDKPTATGGLALTVLRRACLTALVLTVGFSLALGWRPGLIHLLAVAAGWAYNLGLKSRLLSPLPYLLAFGALPVIATQALRQPHWPPGWAVAAAALIGAGAHFGNVLPDLAGDVRAGVLGLPQRLGLRAAAVTAGVLTGLATFLVTVVPNALAVPVSVGGLVLAAVLQTVGIRRTLSGRGGESAFYATMLCAALDVGLLVAGGRLG